MLQRRDLRGWRGERGPGGNDAWQQGAEVLVGQGVNGRYHAHAWYGGPVGDALLGVKGLPGQERAAADAFRFVGMADGMLRFAEDHRAVPMPTKLMSSKQLCSNHIAALALCFPIPQVPGAAAVAAPAPPAPVRGHPRPGGGAAGQAGGPPGHHGAVRHVRHGRQGDRGHAEAPGGGWVAGGAHNAPACYGSTPASRIPLTSHRPLAPRPQPLLLRPPP